MARFIELTRSVYDREAKCTKAGNTELVNLSHAIQIQRTGSGGVQILFNGQVDAYVEPYDTVRRMILQGADDA